MMSVANRVSDSLLGWAPYDGRPPGGRLDEISQGLGRLTASLHDCDVHHVRLVSLFLCLCLLDCYDFIRWQYFHLLRRIGREWKRLAVAAVRFPQLVELVLGQGRGDLGVRQVAVFGRVFRCVFALFDVSVCCLQFFLSLFDEPVAGFY